MMMFSGFLQATIVGSLKSVMVVVFTPGKSALQMLQTLSISPTLPTQPAYHPLLWEEAAASQIVTVVNGKPVICFMKERSSALGDLVTERSDLVKEVREVTGEPEPEGAGAVTWRRS